MRTSTVIILSSVLGVLVGFGTAKSALTINAWNPQLELKKHAPTRTYDENAKAKVPETLHYFGVKNIKEKGQHIFTVSNIGTAPLTLEVDQLSCSCTGIEPQKQTIAPGGTGTLTLKWNAERATSDVFEQGGTIVTNDKDYPEIRLEVQGVFVDPIVFSPPTITFSNVAPGETVSANIRIYGFEKEPLQIFSAEWDGKEHFDFSFNSSTLTQTDNEHGLYKHAQSVFEGTVAVKSGLPIGPIWERFSLKTNYGAFDFTVRGEVHSDGIAVTGMGYGRETSFASLGKTSSIERRIGRMSITFSGPSASRADLKVKDVKPDWLQTQISQMPGVESARKRTYLLHIEIPVGSPVCNYDKPDEESVAMIVLDTGLTERPILKIPVRFTVEQ